MRFIFLTILLVSAQVQAEIYKLAIPSESGMKFYWWPVLPEVEGWHHDREHSLMYSSNAQAPDGFTFANAETVIYSKALYKPRVPETKSIAELIKSDKKEFLSRAPDLIVKKVDPLVTDEGVKLQSFTFFPSSNGNWERVTYGEEGDYYIIFTISSRSKKGYQKSLVDYEKFIGQYKEKP